MVAFFKNICCIIMECFQSEDSSHPKSITLHVSVGTVSNSKSSKYSLHPEKISFLSLMMFPAELLMEVEAFKLFSRK